MIAAFQSVTLWVVVVAAIAAFIEGSLWNSPFLFGSMRLQLAGIDPDVTISPIQPAMELLRCLSVSLSLAILIKLVGPDSLLSALAISVLIWFGFQATLLFGGIVWENMPIRLYIIHTGDALVKIMLVTAILFRWG